MHIRKDDLTGERIIRFLQEHLDNMHEISPPESIHALDLEGLRAPDITFWSAWEEDELHSDNLPGDDLYRELLGCGALKELDATTGEVKSMRTVVAHRGKGVGARLLEHILTEAKRRAYTSLHLETGSQSEFAPARALYKRYGFEYRGPFADYTDDPNSVFMTKKL